MTIPFDDQEAASSARPRLGAFTDDPGREIAIGAAAAGAFLFSVFPFAAFAPLPAAEHAAAVVVVSGRRQAVQSPTGGVVSALRVREGDVVKAGQVLVEFADSDAAASAHATAARVLELKAEIARLSDERSGLTTVNPPPEFAQLVGDEKALADRAIADEQRQFATQRNSDAARRAVLSARILQIAQQVTGYERQIASNQRQQALNEKELEGTRFLAAKGYAPETRVDALQRTAAGLQGDAGAQQAEIARLRQLANETRLQMLSLSADRAQAAAEEMRKAQAELQQLEPSLKASRALSAYQLLRAPTAGSVVGLKINTVGAVAARGETLMEIVPKDSRLVLDARISPKAVGDLHAGMTAKVRLPASDLGAARVAPAVLRRLSADSLIDERTGAPYFSAEVVVSPGDLPRAQAGGSSRLRPGMQVEVLIPVRKRSLLQFWIEPLTHAMWSSMRER